MKVIITANTDNFKRRILRLTSRLPAASATGVQTAMLKFKDDCLNQIPKCPVDTGKLADSHQVLPVTFTSSKIVGTLFVPGPYAASLHEGISRWGKPYKFKSSGTGAKWVQSKMLRNRRKYMRMIEQSVQRVLI